MPALLEASKGVPKNHRRTASSISQGRALHDERNAKGYLAIITRIPGGAGDLCCSGQIISADPVKIRRRSHAIATASRHTYLSLPMNSDAPFSRKMLALLRPWSFPPTSLGQ